MQGTFGAVMILLGYISFRLKATTPCHQHYPSLDWAPLSPFSTSRQYERQVYHNAFVQKIVPGKTNFGVALFEFDSTRRAFDWHWLGGGIE